MTRLPNVNDVKALAGWVGHLLPEPLRDYLLFPWRQWWGHPFTEQDREREAVAAARQGNFKLLGILKEQRVPLGAEAEALIASRLQETFKAPRGKPKQTEAQRRAGNPIHDAADEVAPIEDLLREYYYSHSGHHDLAIDIAAYRAGIDRERLAKHLSSPNRIGV
jgi:hypothetical protein